MSYMRALIESHGGDEIFVNLTGATPRSLRGWKLNGMSRAEGRYLTAILEHVNREVSDKDARAVRVVPRALMESVDVVQGCVLNAGGFEAAQQKTDIPPMLLRKYISRGSLRGSDPVEHALALAALGKIETKFLIEDGE